MAPKPRSNRTDLLVPVKAPTLPSAPMSQPSTMSPTIGNIQTGPVAQSPPGLAGAPGPPATGAPAPSTFESRYDAAIHAATAAPGANQPLNRPTENPGEHVMTGAPSGPGAGPELLGLPIGAGTDPTAALQALAFRYQDPDLQALLAQGAYVR